MDTMDMERGLLLLNLAMAMVMDMVTMDMDTMDMVKGLLMQKQPLSQRLSQQLLQSLVMDMVVMAMDMEDMAITAMEVMDTMDMVMERGLLMHTLPLLLKLNRQLLLNQDMDMVMDMVTMDMVIMAMEAMDTMDMERGRLKQSLDMDMVMDMATMDMEAMVTDMATMDTMGNICRQSLFQIYHCCS